MKVAASLAACVAALILLAFALGIRVVVIQPIGAIPNGVTAIVYGVKNVNWIDSPDAICQRHYGGVSLLCRGREAAAIAREGQILMRLPYSALLFRASGAPLIDR